MLRILIGKYIRRIKDTFIVNIDLEKASDNV